MLKGLLIGILLGVVFVMLGAYLYFASGRAPVATDSPDMPFERTMVRTAMRAYQEKLPRVQPPMAADETVFLQATKIYMDHCAVCHGLPGQEKTFVAQGMYPQPPQLFKGTGVTDDEPWETYWKVESGIRLTGMPGFKTRLSETQIWQVTLLLKNADKISPAVRGMLTPGPVGGASGVPTDSKPAPAVRP